METLIDLFEKTDVGAEGLVSPEDANFFTETERAYLEWVGELKQAIATIPECQKTAAESTTLVGELTLLRDKLTKQIETARLDFVGRIIFHLNTQYNISLNIDLAKDATNWKEVISMVSTGSDATFFTQGLTEAIKKFHNWLYPSKASLKGAVVTLSHYRMRDYDWDVVSYWNKGFQSLCTLIWWHQDGSLSYNQQKAEPLLKNFTSVDDVGEVIPVNLPKLKGYKVYKNHRLDLIFQSNEYAHDFFQKTKLADASAR